MAYTKIFARSVRVDDMLRYVRNAEKTSFSNAVDDIIDYAANPEKTAEQIFVSTMNCTRADAVEEMMATKKRWGKEDGVQCYHIIQSFAPGEVTPDLAHRIGRELAERMWGENYEVVIGTHVDKGHIHNHICINSVACTDGRKYRSTPATYFYGIRTTSDELCHKYGLSVIEPTGRGLEYAEWKAAHEGEKTKRDRVREDIDDCIRRSVVFPEWVKNMRSLGYIIDFDRKHTRIFRPEGGKAFRLTSLGKEYSEDAIIRRILTNDDPLPMLPPRTRTRRVQYVRVTHPRRRFRRAIIFRGMQAQYYKYMFRFGALPVKRLPRLKLDALEVRRFEQTAKRLKMICDNRITTTAQLREYAAARKEDMAVLNQEKKQLHNKKKAVRSTSELDQLDVKISGLSAQIQRLRSECRMCGQIEQQEQEIRESQERMNQVREKERQAQKNKTNRRNKHVR